MQDLAPPASAVLKTVSKVFKLSAGFIPESARNPRASEASFAPKLVDAPKRLASFAIAVICSVFAPDNALTLDMDFSNSADLLIATPNPAATIAPPMAKVLLASPRPLKPVFNFLDALPNFLKFAWVKFADLAIDLKLLLTFFALRDSLLFCILTFWNTLDTLSFALSSKTIGFLFFRHLLISSS